MTIIVILVLAGCLAAGMAMIRQARRSRDAGGDSVVCPACRKGNAGRARFCAHCGIPLR